MSRSGMAESLAFIPSCRRRPASRVSDGRKDRKPGFRPSPERPKEKTPLGFKPRAGYQGDIGKTYRSYKNFLFDWDD
jgi:hypothetical protein